MLSSLLYSFHKRFIRIDSLKGEVELLNEDNFNLETEIKILKDEREQVIFSINFDFLLVPISVALVVTLPLPPQKNAFRPNKNLVLTTT